MENPFFKHSYTITPANTVFTFGAVEGIYVGGAGTVVVHMAADANTANTTTFTAVPVGTVLQVKADIVFTNTTATNLIGLV